MTPHQVKLVQDSFAKVAPIADQAASLFYGRLFDIAPDVRSLFKGDMAEQGRKLMATLATAVNSLGRLDELGPALADLGRRHADYGVLEAHYPAVGAALIWTLQRGLGDAFTEEVREAWVSVYNAIGDRMKAACAS